MPARDLGLVHIPASVLLFMLPTWQLTTRSFAAPMDGFFASVAVLAITICVRKRTTRSLDHLTWRFDAWLDEVRDGHHRPFALGEENDADWLLRDGQRVLALKRPGC